MKFSISLLITLLVLLSLNVFSQNNMSNATVVLHNSKIIEGHNVMFYESDTISINLVDSSGNITSYLIDEVKSIRNEKSLLRSIKTSNKTKLYEAIIEGKHLSLYKRLVNQETYYYVLESDKLYFLDNRKIYFNVDGSRYTKRSEKYKGVLKVLMKSNKKLVTECNNLEFNERELSNIIIEYNREEISYNVAKDSKNLKREVNWRIYLQYANSISHSDLTQDNLSPRFIQGGAELQLNEYSRHFIKLGLEYGKYSDPIYIYKYSNINISYLYKFYRMKHSNVYLNMRLLDIVFENSSKSILDFYPRFSPGIGYEYTINSNFSLYAELNQLISLKRIPLNFSIGLSYDI